MRIRDAVDDASRKLSEAGIESHRLDAELLVCRAAGIRRSLLFSHGDRAMDEAGLAASAKLVERRLQRVPVAYLLGEREFSGLAFRVTPDVLIPRPETEHLVDEAVACFDGPRRRRVGIDVGTGSGAIAVALAYRVAGLRMIAVDRCERALVVARGNAVRNGVGHRVDFVCGDLLTAFGRLRPGSVDLVVSNPPYITEEELVELPVDVREHEPILALASGADALHFHRAIAAQARRMLAPGGRLMMEVGAARPIRPEDCVDWLDGYGDTRIATDLEGRPRVIVAKRV